jgi:hypothetical protein
MLFPPATVVIVPEPPNELDQERAAPAVALIVNEELAPGQRDAAVVVAVGGIFTITVEFTAGPIHPFNVGVTAYCTEPALALVAVSV